FDNLCNSSAESLRRIEQITGKQLGFVQADLRDRDLLTRTLTGERFGAVLHFAGLKAVGESVERPLDYYDNNVRGTQVLLECLQQTQVRRLVFSSSATVYGDPVSVPIREDALLAPTNPYGRSKLIIEWMLSDLARADPRWSIGLLRYFNPVGAHPSGLIGEDPTGIPNNLMPSIAQVAAGRQELVSVFGSDWPTRDGTGVRDYIHVVDLARGHVAALNRLIRQPGCFAVNLGTGKGLTVLEMIAAYERVSGRRVPYRFADRRAGDIAQCYADATLAQSLLGWRAELGLDRMCQDSWRWQHANPNGYRAAQATGQG
ncbi:MAG: UDP-glucose 4-epimerase GalE, partial [Quisquiliibacterium sp.]